MGILTDEMKRVVRQQRLAFVATVCADNSPNRSPKGTIAVWDDDNLVFANIRSPQTVPNLRRNPAVEINVVDPMVRKGYRFKGKCHGSAGWRYLRRRCGFPQGTGPLDSDPRGGSHQG